MPSRAELEVWRNTAKEAMKGSIAHWKRLADGEAGDDEYIGPDDCACCMEFIGDRCRECPIALYVDADGCSNTPYRAVDALWCKSTDPQIETRDSDEFKRLARAEYEFLLEVAKALEEGQIDDLLGRGDHW